MSFGHFSFEILVSGIFRTTNKTRVFILICFQPWIKTILEAQISNNKLFASLDICEAYETKVIL